LRRALRSLVSLYPPRRPRRSTLFPYTTLFRSLAGARQADRLPVGLRNGLPQKGVVNYLEAQALIRRLEAWLRENPAASCRVAVRSEEHTSELQSPYDLVCCLLLEKKKTQYDTQ